MKKTMFITSVIMVVVMAIALTTSSLAWFSASGADSVTTNTLKVTAQGTTSTGIAISHDGGSTWANSIGLSTTGTTGLNPLVPFTGIDVSTAGNSDIAAALLAALDGTSEDAFDADDSDTFNYYGTAADDTTYTVGMIGAKIDSNRRFTNEVYRAGYYTDQLWLKNLATGSGAKNIRFTVDIEFGFHKLVLDPETEQNVLTYFEYTSGNRGASLYQEDAVLCVAVLARTDEFDTDSNLDTVPVPGYADPGTWEIVGYADSKGRTTISLGKTGAEFFEGADSAVSYADKSISALGLNKTSTEQLRPERAGDSGRTLAPTVKTVKVIAWYDGATLNNNNSTKMDLEFNLTFNKVVVD